MCFSPAASFGASATLLVIGAISLKYSSTRPQQILSSVPLMLSIQQFCEGILWLSLGRPEYAEWEKPANYVFLLFAQIIWPFYIPLAIMLLEKQALRRKILSWLFLIGIVQALYLAYGITLYNVKASIEGSHIRYNLDFPGANQWFSGVLYIIATGIAPFVSGIKRMRLMGIIILFSYLYSRILFEYYVISVWCYFAALISFVVLAVILQLRKKAEYQIYETQDSLT